MAVWLWTGKYKSSQFWWHNFDQYDLKDLCCNFDQHNIRVWCRGLDVGYGGRWTSVTRWSEGRWYGHIVSWYGHIGRRDGHGKSTWKWSTPSYYQEQGFIFFNIHHRINTSIWYGHIRRRDGHGKSTWKWSRPTYRILEANKSYKADKSGRWMSVTRW